MTISVALCTYNGALFIDQQLESLATQLTLPSELIVCDDCSSDDTVARIRRFAAHAPFPVRMLANDRTLGVTQNFAKAIALCQGDLIALCDQDDVWSPARLHRAVAVLEDGSVGLVFSDADVVNDRLESLGYTIWEASGFTPAAQPMFDTPAGAVALLLRRQVVTGATVTFRASLRPLVLPIPMAWVHDAFIAMVAAAVSRIRAVPETLVQYRQHQANVIGGRRVGITSRAIDSTRERWRFSLGVMRDKLGPLRDRLAACADDGSHDPGRHTNTEAILALLDDAHTHFRLRAGLPDRRAGRVVPVAFELASGRYGRYSRG